MRAYNATDQKLLTPDAGDSHMPEAVMAARGVAEALETKALASMNRLIPILRGGGLEASGRLAEAANEWRPIHREAWRKCDASVQDWLRGDLKLDGLAYRGIRVRSTVPILAYKAALAYSAPQTLLALFDAFLSTDLEQFHEAIRQLALDLQSLLLAGDLVGTFGTDAAPLPVGEGGLVISLSEPFIKIGEVVYPDAKVTLREHRRTSSNRTASTKGGETTLAPRGAVSASANQVYSPKMLGFWFMTREAGWNSEVARPSERDDRAAAKDHFGIAIPRDEFRRIRQEKTSENWRKRGPRRGG